jgi:hypothetical protein
VQRDPTATATLSESTARLIGIRTRWSAAASTASLQAGAPVPDEPCQPAGAWPPGEQPKGFSGFARGQRRHRESRRAHLGERGGPLVQPRERHAEHCAHRRPDRFAIERIAAGRTQQHAGAKCGGVPEDAADVVRIRDAFEDHDGFS